MTACLAESRDTVSRLLEEYERGGAQSRPAPSPPSFARRAASSAYRARSRVPGATPITNYGTAYDTFQYKLSHAPSPPQSHISVPYSPPLFLG